MGSVAVNRAPTATIVSPATFQPVAGLLVFPSPTPTMDTLVRDARYALRLLAKTPGFTAVAILTMAVAIGSCVSRYSVLQAVVLRPLPYASPDRLVVIQSVNRETHAQTAAVSWS